MSYIQTLFLTVVPHHLQLIRLNTLSKKSIYLVVVQSFHLNVLNNIIEVYKELSFFNRHPPPQTTAIEEYMYVCP